MGELAPPLKIGVHHLLCVLGFRGLGDSRVRTLEEGLEGLETS